MIASVLRLTRWELFKLGRRWMPWILLGIVVVITQCSLWGSNVAYHSETVQEFFFGEVGPIRATLEKDGQSVPIALTCADILSGNIPPEIEALSERERRDLLGDVEAFRADCADIYEREEVREGFVLPSSITTGMGAANTIGAILIMILAASVLGTEYGSGALRSVLAKGVRRWQLLASKLLLLLLMAAAGLIVISALNAIASLIAAVIPPDEAGGLLDSGKWSDIALTFGKVVYGLAPYVALGAFLTVLTSSSAMGISISLGYYVIEMIATPFLLLAPWLENIPDFLIGHNVNLWLTQTAFVSVEVTRDGVPVDMPGALHAFLVMLAYIAALGAAAFWIFQRRDITGAKGD